MHADDCSRNNRCSQDKYSKQFWSTWVSYGSVKWIAFVRPAGRPSVCLAWQKLERWTLHANFSTKDISYMPCLWARFASTRLLPFYTTFTDLDLASGSQGKHKANPLGFIFSHTFQLIRMKVSMVLKQFKLNTLILYLGEINEAREVTHDLLTESKTLTLACIRTFASRFRSKLVWL